MHTSIKLISLFFISIFLMSCNGSKKVVSTEVEERQLDTLTVKPGPETEKHVTIENPYRSSNTKVMDMIHLGLDVRFNWADESLIGKAILTFKPHFYEQSHLVLDAKGFEIISITDKSGKTLVYQYDTKKIDINLGRSLTRDQEGQITITYIARPNEFESEGGSAAITSDKGLYFINADGSDIESPQQIWTQGETQSNSMWMPIIDSPNQKIKTTIRMTVQDKYLTLSNGIKTHSKKLENNMRQDVWEMDMPHAPYLVMLAVGDFAVVKDKWNDIDLEYIVEHDYKDDAKDIFPHTPEMLGFFSDLLGVKYPWQKYSQIIVREYVSGAMENTTAVVFGDFVQKHKGDMIDKGNDYIVAHEMFHHWFGDLVTTESWSNLTLNEGFANYSEYLWQEHKYGKDAADQHLRDELSGYLYSAMTGTHPLIDFHYGSREDMFDGHSYNKGGCTLHMLRNYLGDDAFFSSLKLYLDENALGAVEIHDLRLAFEDVSGEDLNWFFNQWFLTQGHPVLNVQQAYSIENKTLSITLDQSMNKNNFIYRLPLAIDIYDKVGNIERKMVDFDTRNDVFSFVLDYDPALVIVDADRSLVGEIEHVKTAEQYAFQYKNSKMYLDRYEALTYFENNSNSSMREVIIKEALNDNFWEIRKKALIDLEGNKDVVAQVASMANGDKNAKVRAEAMMFLGTSKDPKYTAQIIDRLKTEKSNVVIGNGLNALGQIDQEKAYKMAESFETTKSSAILKSLAIMYFDMGKTEKLSFYENNFKNVKEEDAIYFLMNYGKLGANAGGEKLDTVIKTLHQIGLSHEQSLYQNIGAVSGLGEAAGQLQGKDEAGFNKALSALQDIIAKENNPQLKSYYKQMMGG